MRAMYVSNPANRLLRGETTAGLVLSVADPFLAFSCFQPPARNQSGTDNVHVGPSRVFGSSHTDLVLDPALHPQILASQSASFLHLPAQGNDAFQGDEQDIPVANDVAAAENETSQSLHQPVATARKNTAIV